MKKTEKTIEKRTTFCGADCAHCTLKDRCAGCLATCGKPFGDTCVKALCCQKREQESCAACKSCTLVKKLLACFNALNIKDMPKAEYLVAINGHLLNLAYPLPNGNKVKFLLDERIYLGMQLPKKNSDHYFGLCADEQMLLVCEYEKDEKNPVLLHFSKHNIFKETETETCCTLVCQPCWRTKT